MGGGGSVGRPPLLTSGVTVKCASVRGLSGVEAVLMWTAALEADCTVRSVRGRGWARANPLI